MNNCRSKSNLYTILFILVVITIIYMNVSYQQILYNSFTQVIGLNTLQIKQNYIINLDRRPDRWDKFISTMNSNKLFSKEPYTRFSAFDGNKHTEELERFKLVDHPLIKKIKEKKLVVPKGVFGCMISHLMILYKIRDDPTLLDNDYVGIFEDDFFFSNNFDTNYAIFKTINLNSLDVELLYLGGRSNSDYNIVSHMHQRTSNPNIYYRSNYDIKSEDIWCRGAFSYAVRKSACNKLIDCIINDFLSPKYGDPFKPVDHIYTDAYQTIKTFDFFPHLFYAEVNAPYSDIQHSLNNKIEFYSNNYIYF